MAKKIEKEIVIKVTDDGTLKKSTRSVNNLNKAIDKNNKKSGNLDRNMKGNAKMSSNASKNFSKQSQGMQGVLVPAYAEVAARVFALTAAFTALSRAADYNILIKGQAAYAIQTGKNMGSIAKSIQSASKHMLNFGEASKSAALATTAGISTKSIVRMTEAALDASAALGRNMADSMDRLTRGIVKAEPEILDEIGIIIRLDRVYKDYAETLDKTTTQLTEFDKLQARTNAILGQAEKKFGGIADTLPANTFEKLSASVLDLASSGGALLANFLTPLIDGLAASTNALTLFIAYALKGLIGKMFPAFAGFGAGFTKMTSKIISFGAASKGWGEKVSNNLRIKNTALKTSRDIFGKGFANTATTAGSDLGKFMAKGFKSGKALPASIKKAIAVTLGAGIASASRNDGISQVGRTKGMDVKELKRLRSEFKKINKLQSEIGKSRWATAIAGGAALATSAVSKLAAGIATSVGTFGTLVGAISGGVKALGGLRVARLGIGAAFKEKITFNRDLVPKGLLGQLDAINHRLVGMKEGWRAVASSGGKAGKKMLVTNAAMWATRAALGAVTTALSGLVHGLGMLTSVVGGVMMVQWVAGWFLDLDASMGKLHKSLDGVLEALAEVDKTIGARLGTDAEFYAKIAIDYSDILDAKAFKANLIDQISQGMDAAMSDILKNRAIQNTWGGLMDWVYTVNPFSDGSTEKMAKIISHSITQAMHTAGKDVEEFSGVWSVLQDTLKDGEGRFKTFSGKEFSKELDDIKAGGELTQIQILALRDNMQDALGNLSAEEVEKVYAKVGGSLRAIQVDTAKSEKDFTALGEALREVGKEMEGIVKSSIPTTDFDTMVEQYESALINMKSSTTDSVEQFSAIFESGLSKFIDTDQFDGEFMDTLDTYRKQDDARKALLKSILKAQKSFQTAEADGAKKALAAVSLLQKESGKVLGEGVKKKGGIESVIGFDPRNVQKLIRNLAQDTETLGLMLVELKPFGDSAMREEAKINVALLGKEREILKQHLKLAKMQLDVEKEGSPERAKKLDTYNRIQTNVDNITTKMEQANRTAQKWQGHMHEIAGTTYLLSQRFKDMAIDGASGNVFEQFKSDEINKSWNEFNNSLSDTFDEEQKILKIMDDIVLKVGELGSTGLTENFAKTFSKAFPTEKAFKNTYKWILLSQTAIGKTITSRHEVLNAEKEDRDLENTHFNKLEQLLDLRKTIAKYERDMAGEKNKLIRDELILAEYKAEVEKTSLALRTAAWKESVTWMGEAMQGISESFAEGISTAVSDAVLGRESDTSFAETLATGIANSAGDIVGSMSQKIVFGNDGLLSSGAKALGASDKLLAELFPRTQQEQLQDKLEALKKLAAQRGMLLERIAINTSVTAGATKDGQAALDSKYDALDKKQQTGKYSPVKNLREALDSPTGAAVNLNKKNDDSELGFFDKIWQGIKNFFSGDTTISVPSGLGFNVGTDIDSIKSVINKVTAFTTPVSDKVAITETTTDAEIGSSSIFTELKTVVTDLSATVKEVITPKTESIDYGPKIISTVEGYNKVIAGEITGWTKFEGAALQQRKDDHRLALEHAQDAKAAAKILKEEQGPNSFSVYDHEANTLLKKLDGKLSGTKDTFAKIKPNMTKAEKVVSNLNAQKMETTKEWLKARFPDTKGGSVGAHKTGSSFSDKNPYPRRAYHNAATGQNTMFRGTPDKGFTKGWNPAGAPDVKDISRYDELMRTGSRGAIPTGTGTAAAEVSLLSKMAPILEKLNAVIMMLMPNEGIMDTKTEMESLSELPKGINGALQVQEINPVPAAGANGLPIPTISPTGELRDSKIGTDMRSAMANNLNAQIQNDNVNAKALITNSLSQVGSNLMSSAIGSMFGFANGGTVTGGFRAFASGGTVTKPTLGMVGEGKFNEAVVPLPDGKSIPVIGSTGGGDNNVVVNVNIANDGSASTSTQAGGMDADQGKKLGEMVSQAVQQELIEQKRHGGLLSSY